MQMEFILCEVGGQICTLFRDMFRIVGDNVLRLGIKISCIDVSYFEQLRSWDRLQLRI
jgi:hypothetical protein